MPPLGAIPWGGDVWGGGGLAPGVVLIPRLRLFIGGVDYTDNLLINFPDGTDELNARNTCKLKLRDRGAAVRPVIGAPVELYYGTELKFAGTIDKRKEVRRAGNTELFWQLDCVDFNQFADRELVAEEYVDQTIKEIVQDIVTKKLADDGVTLDPAMPDGIALPYQQFNYKRIDECFNELKDLSGLSWSIDYTKVLRWFDRTTNMAPFSLDTSVFPAAPLADSVELESSRAQYRNSQYVRGGNDITSEVQVEEKRGDGKARTFTVPLPLAKVPVVKVNGAAKTVGIRQVETGKQWYWQENSTELSQDEGEPILADTDTFRCEFYGYFPPIVNALKPMEIAARGAVEGGSGLYEDLQDKREINRSSLALEYAQGLLRKFGEIPLTITYDTFLDGLQAGHLQNVYMPEHGIENELYLITKVDWQDVQKTLIRYRVTAVSGEPLGGWVDFFKKLAEANRTAPARANELLMKLKAYTEILTISESFDVSLDDAVCGEVGDDLFSLEVCA